MSEKDLSICKDCEKMACEFRTAEGKSMYCGIMSVIETTERRDINLLQGIIELMAGNPILN